MHIVFLFEKKETKLYRLRLNDLAYTSIFLTKTEDK